MASHGQATFHDLAAACVDELGLAPRFEVRRVAASSMAQREKARRPERAVMENRRLAAEGLERQRPWRDALAEYLARPYFARLVAQASTPPEIR
jgi:dTDP-4-dehydrorhamnose reductase